MRGSTLAIHEQKTPHQNANETKQTTTMLELNVAAVLRKQNPRLTPHRLKKPCSPPFPEPLFFLDKAIITKPMMPRLYSKLYAVVDKKICPISAPRPGYFVARVLNQTRSTPTHPGCSPPWSCCYLPEGQQARAPVLPWPQQL